MAIRESAVLSSPATGALQFILAHEPGLVLPYLGFNEVDRLYRAASQFAGPHLARFVDIERSSWATEWVVRLVVSYLFTPADGIDLTADDDARHVVRTYLLPALAPQQHRQPAPADRRSTVSVPLTTRS